MEGLFKKGGNQLNILIYVLFMDFKKPRLRAMKRKEFMCRTATVYNSNLECCHTRTERSHEGENGVAEATRNFGSESTTSPMRPGASSKASLGFSCCKMDRNTDSQGGCDNYVGEVTDKTLSGCKCLLGESQGRRDMCPAPGLLL